MSFLDNLENNLKALENLEQRDPEKVKREQAQREAERADALAAAPHAQALRQSAFTEELLRQCRALGHKQRTLVQFTWIGDVLRLDAKQKRLELRPTPAGIVAAFLVDGAEAATEPVDPVADSAEALARKWLEA